MPTTDEWQWIAIGVLSLYVLVLAHGVAMYGKENRRLWEQHLGSRKETD